MITESITTKILSDAQAAASKVLHDAHEKADSIRNKSEQNVTNMREKAMNDAKQDCIALRDRMLRMAELDMRKEMLAMKREEIDVAFNNALNLMVSMPHEKAQEFIKGLLLDVSDGTETIIVSKADAKLYTSKFLSDVGIELAKKGISSDLKLSQEFRDMSGGFILSQKGMEINCTYEAILREKRSHIEAEVAATLFG